MKKKLLLLLLVFALCLTPTADAADGSPSVNASLAFQNGIAYICAEVSAPGQTIETTISFRQGENRRMVWRYSGQSALAISETSNIMPDQTCTVVITGTIDGQEFAPVQLVQTA